MVDGSLVDYLCQNIVSKSLYRFGDDLYYMKNNEFSKYKSIEEYVGSMEGVPLKLAAVTTDESRRSVVSLLKTFVGTELPDLRLEPKLISLGGNVTDLTNGDHLSTLDSWDKSKPLPVLKLDHLNYNSEYVPAYETMFKTLDLELIYGILGYMIDPEPHQVWDNVCLLFRGKDVSLDELVKLIELLFGATYGIGQSGLRNFNKNHLRLVLGFPDDDDVESYLSTQRIEGETLKPKLLLLDSDGSCKTLVQDFNHRIICLTMNTISKLMSKHEWRTEIGTMISKISYYYQSLTNKMIQNRIHPCDIFEKEIYTPNVTKKRSLNHMLE